MVCNAFQIRLQMCLSLDALVAHIRFQHLFCVTRSATHSKDIQRNHSASEQLLAEQYGGEHILWIVTQLDSVIVWSGWWWIYISPASPAYIATDAYEGTTATHAAMLELSGHWWTLIFFRSYLKVRSNCQLSQCSFRVRVLFSLNPLMSHLFKVALHGFVCQ